MRGADEGEPGGLQTQTQRARAVSDLCVPEPTTTKAPEREGQTHEVLFVLTETPSHPLNTRLTSGGINYHVSARNLTQEIKEGHSLPRGLPGGRGGGGGGGGRRWREALNEPLSPVIEGLPPFPTPLQPGPLSLVHQGAFLSGRVVSEPGGYLTLVT